MRAALVVIALSLVACGKGQNELSSAKSLMPDQTTAYPNFTSTALSSLPWGRYTFTPANYYRDRDEALNSDVFISGPTRSVCKFAAEGGVLWLNEEDGVINIVWNNYRRQNLGDLGVSLRDGVMDNPQLTAVEFLTVKPEVAGEKREFILRTTGYFAPFQSVYNNADCYIKLTEI